MLAQSNRQQFLKNAILTGLPRPELAAISRFLVPVALKERMILQEPKRPVKHVYFVESGIVSLRIVAAESIFETAVVGYRGVVGASFLLGGHILTQQCVVLFPGNAFRIEADNLHSAMSELPQLREHLSRYVQALVTHGAQTGLCGVRHELERRLACWLSLTCDALNGHALPLTHDYFSLMGLRRAGVTETLIRFEEQGLIRKTRGLLRVDDRGNLARKACGCYGVIASAYASVERLARAEHPG
ncbi:Crp/Fnr family transcriptional regulator [Bradyrhizobium sp. 6(2017)]|uniref:Crp/Fnr family transcriptional regulator n=1 Tax=Bradyrhizobium sp. 6(2017) TaxID=1197460 RepID=UPI0013E12B32|nr:Crp/Fnr family transcriptional regulator [Bradyrhizobium sp. 6(2017)]QIG97663.1 Crp/Fnr family transcriptional regulator [Bradyrhizobium sp. 6(2017)]